MSKYEVYQNRIESISTYDQICKIEEEWNKFVEGKSMNIDVVPEIIYQSWRKSKENRVNPFSLHNNFLIKNNSKPKDLAEYNEVISTYGGTLEEIQQIVNINGFTFLFFDKYCKTNQITDIVNHIHYKLDSKDIVGMDVSENSIGANAITLTLIEKKPIKFLGVYHYNKYGHERANAVTAPVFNNKGEILGVFCILIDNYKRVNEAFVLVMSLAKLFEAKISLRVMENSIEFHRGVLKNIIEYIPQGMIYISNNDIIQYYNKRILDILKVKKTKNTKLEIAKYLPMINKKSMLNKESILNINEKEVSIMVSSREINNSDNKGKDKIIFLEEIKNNLKVYQKNIENSATYTFEDIIGNNKRLIEAKAIANKVAGTSVPVLISGESGTGKELFAQAIHNSSLRNDGPFVAINCGAIPSELVESELFGYEGGSFTGALNRGKKGKIEVASGGTLFLDEIESMPLNVQIKLLRTLSTNMISKIGGIREIPMDVRIISATKKDLLKEADNESFREDLYYRISTFTIELPSLRERIDDITVLSKYFIDKFSKKYGLINLNIHKEFLNALPYYYWRGNIRELENVIERAFVLIGDNEELTINQLPKKILKAYVYKSTKKKLNSSNKIKNSSKDLLKIGEEIIIESVLKKTNCSLSKASEILGVSRKTLYNKVNESDKLSSVKNSYNI